MWSKTQKHTSPLSHAHPTLAHGLVDAAKGMIKPPRAGEKSLPLNRLRTTLRHHLGGGLLAFACPVCDTGTGEQVRSGIMGTNLLSGLLATITPFSVLLLLVVVLHFGLPTASTDRSKKVVQT